MTPTALRARSRPAAILLAVVVVLLLGASPAGAHGELERSDPPNGGMVAVGRSSLTLWFTDAIGSGASSFDLHTVDGVQVAAQVSVSGADGRGFVQIETEPLPKAVYVLDWRVLSLDDGHASRGSVLFGVGTRPDLVPSVGGGLPQAPGLVLRWLDLAAILLAIGAFAVSGRVLGSMGAAGRSERRRARAIGAVAAGVAVVTGVLTPFLRTQRDGGSLAAWFEATWSTLADTRWGQVWLARELALVVAAGALCRWAIRRDEPGTRVPVVVVPLAAVVALESWAGHASALPGRSALAAAASASHLVAAGVWAGGLIVLAVCLIPLLRQGRGTAGPALASVWRAFSPVAAVAAGVLLATGLYESGRHLPDLRSVTSTVYGNAVAGKVALLAVALILAGFNTLLVNPRLAAPVARALGRSAGWSPVPPHRFRVMIAAEVVVLVVAVGAAAVLTSVPTARELAASTGDTSVRSANVDGLLITFEAVPAGPDRSRLIVRTRSTVKPEPGAITAVEVLLIGPGGTSTNVSLEPVEPGRYEAAAGRTTPGGWTASVAVQRDGAPLAVAQVGWTVAPVDTEGAGTLEVAATGVAVLLLAAIAGAVAAGVARRRPDHPTTAISAVSEKAGSHR